MPNKLNFILLAFTLAGLGSCQSSQQALAPALITGMFKVAILYPNGEDKTFDMDYYQKKHMPMVAGFLGKNLILYEIDKGLSGRTPNDKPPYAAIGYFFITDIGEYNKAITQNREAVITDFKNYTNIQPVVQISEIKQVEYPGKK